MNQLYKKPEDFMNAAIETVAQRGVDNGYDAGEERSAAQIAELFNMLTGHNLSEADAWTFLIVLKLVRNRRNYRADNVVDLIGYAGLLGECLETTQRHAREQQRNTERSIMAAMNFPGQKPTAAHTGGQPPVVDIDVLARALENAPRAPAPEKQAPLKPNDVQLNADLRNLPSMEASFGSVLDQWGTLYGISRRSPSDLLTEADSSYRLRLIIAREAAREEGCKATHYTEQPLACCAHESYDELDGGGCRCNDCGEHFEKAGPKAC